MAEKASNNLEKLDNDLKSFLDFCKDNHLTEEEITRVCEPLTLWIKKEKFKHHLRLLLSFLLVLTLLYGLTYFERVSWNLSAIGRIFLIHLLPYWDWRHLKNEKCLIPNFINPQENSGPSFDCALCEAINTIHVETQVEPDYLKEHYIELHKPVILLDALQNWPIYHNYSLNILQHDEAVYNSIPCKLSTNIHSGYHPKVGKILKKVKDFDEYFLHFQNCDFDATKAFRVVSPRPKFLPAEISPVQYNWLLISKNYNVSNYKLIELKEPITVIGQVTGSNLFRLLPRRNCKTECPILGIELSKGEAVIFTSLWDVEYKPNPITENVAIILEMH